MNSLLRKIFIPKLQPTPIFIISFNRKWQLERSLASYRQLGDIDIIIHDNGSDEPDVVTYLKQLESTGITVNRYPKITSQIELNKINESIKKYFQNHPATNYIVTDPDIELSPGAERTLDIYECLLNKYPEIDSVGSMLKIDDIPTDYPLYNNVLNRHIDQFWGQKPTLITCNQEKIAFLKCKIDTTFAMHRAGKDFKRLTDGMRLYGKYSARHLDWYEKNISDDPYFVSSSPAVAHWGSSAFYQKFKNDKLKYKTYFDIQESDSEVRIVKKKINT